MLLACGASPAQQPAKTAPEKDMVLRGDAKCTRCHDKEEEYPVLEIGKTRHGVRADKRTPTCTDCHGASEQHANAEKGRRPPKPDRLYGGFLARPPVEDRVDRYFGVAGKRTQTPVEDRNAACLACHDGGKRTHWATSTHANRDVACTSCHQIHIANEMVRDKVAQTEVCFNCHKDLRAQINRPSRHPLKEGKVACADCHNPHGTPGPKNLVRNNVNDTCYQCHMEKRGPFVRTHAPVQEDCSICHNPHGTMNDNLLRVRPPWLCQQCHEPTSHRGNLANFAGTGTSTNVLARGCVNCHTNIHGTNNVFNDAGERSLRR